jgi:hypothetical protein
MSGLEGSAFPPPLPLVRQLQKLGLLLAAELQVLAWS